MIVKQKVSPFADTPYEKQLESKREYITELLEKIKEIGRKNCTNQWYER